MAWKEYGYLGVWEGDQVVYRPYVTLLLKGSSATLSADALVDSGADGMVINASFAEALGIDPVNCQPARLGGSTGTKDCFMHEIAYEVDGFPHEVITTNAIFVEDLSVPCLVGQEDFFTRFVVQFEKASNLLKIKLQAE